MTSDSLRCCLPPEESLESEIGGRFELPTSHLELLHAGNGVLGYHGYYRIFGVYCGRGCINLVDWNDRETWKFAWQRQELDNFMCFGETAWGDQYAYYSPELARGVETVYFLDAIAMKPESISRSFRAFLEQEFLPASRVPYDQMVIEAYQRFGNLEWDDHVVYVPPLLLGGEENPNQIERMNARQAMILQGDLATQLAGETWERQVLRLDTYLDGEKRVRLKVIWADEGS